MTTKETAVIKMATIVDGFMKKDFDQAVTVFDSMDYEKKSELADSIVGTVRNALRDSDTDREEMSEIIKELYGRLPATNARMEWARYKLEDAMGVSAPKEEVMRVVEENESIPDPTPAEVRAFNVMRLEVAMRFGDIGEMRRLLAILEG